MPLNLDPIKNLIENDFMTDTVEIWRRENTQELPVNLTTLRVVRGGDTKVYDGKCMLSPMFPVSAEEYQGDTRVYVNVYRLRVPLEDTASISEFDRGYWGVITDCLRDPTLAGLEFRVHTEVRGSFVVTRSLVCHVFTRESRYGGD